MPTIADYLKYANLQMAAEALFGFVAPKTDPNQPPPALVPGQPTSGAITEANLITGNLHASKFTSTEAAKFAAQWTVVEHISNTSTGFSGTLFKALKDDPSQNIKAGELVLSFRSTEFLDDHARDNTATNVLEISEKGFAFGQLADMEAWYADLSKPGGPLAGKTVSVTGYSLGGHLATAFNLLHPGVATQVINFNGAGLGRIGDGSLATMRSQLPLMIARFQALRSQGETSGFLDKFQSEAGRDAYLAIQAQLASTLGVPRDAVGGFNDALTALAESVRPSMPDDAGAAQRQYDYNLIHEAVSRIKMVYEAAHRAPTLPSGSTDPAVPPNPATIPDLAPDGRLAIAGESIDYQLAVLLTQIEFDTQALGLGDSIDAARGDPKPVAGGPLLNQWDVVGSETASTEPWYGVAYSQYRYGNDVKVLIEDQPFARGDFLSATLAELFNGNIQLLHPNYALNDFGDTHSLVLLVDSLNVQNTLLNLVSVGLRTETAKSLDTILKDASWRKAEKNGGQGLAEGDVLENVINSLADLFLGPQLAGQRLNGSPDGNTWASIGDPAGYSGREKFYAKLKSITDTDAYKALAGKLTLAPIASSTAKLKEDAREDFGAFAALYSLSPFVLSGAGIEAALEGIPPLEGYWGSILTQWKADRDAVLLGAERSALNFSQDWYDDRARFLEQKTGFNRINLNPNNPDLMTGTGDAATPALADVYFRDVESDYTIQQGRLDGSSARRTFFGGSGSDVFAGGSYADHLYGGTGNDTLAGNAGDDLLDGGAGNDTLDGGDGFDRYRVGQKATDRDTVIDADGKGRLTDASGRIIAGAFVAKEGGGYALIGNPAITAVKDASDLVITLQNGATLVLSGFANVPGGMLGVHLFETPAAADMPRIKGDLAPIDSNVSTPEVDLSYDILGNVNVSAIAAPGRNDTLYGGVSNDLMIGGGGSDILRGKGGVDILFGEVERTLAQVIADAETQPASGARGDLLDGGTNDDIVVGAGGNDVLLGAAGNDLMFGGSGDDAMSGDQYLVSQPTSEWSTGTAPNFLRSPDVEVADSDESAQGADVMYGGAGRDLIAGMGGDDYLDGGSGDDVLWAGTGNDIAIGGTGSDVIGGADDNDALYGTSTAALSELGGSTARGDLIDGGAGNDYLAGSAARDALLGGKDSDTLVGGAGDDLLLGDAAITGDIVDTWEIKRNVATGDDAKTYTYTLEGVSGLDDGNSAGGADALYGGAGNDWLLGNYGDDLLDGGTGDDVLFGNDGNDTLIGGRGNDLLVGGAGQDTYFFHKGDGEETIYDENVGGSDASILVFGQGIAKEGIKLRKGSLLLDLGDGDAVHIDNFDADNPLATQSFSSFQFADGSSLTWEGLLERGFDLDGTEGNDTLFGTGVLDRIDGKGGDDILVGLDGDDILIGGTGMDNMLGGLGNDTYVFNAGDGTTIASDSELVVDGLYDEGGDDTVRFTASVDPANLAISDAGNGDLRIDYQLFGQPIDRLLIEGGQARSIEHFQITPAGGTEQTLDYEAFIGAHATGSFRATDAEGVTHVAGGKSNDLLLVNEDNATVSAGQGNDTLILSGNNATVLAYRGDGSDDLSAQGANATMRFADQSVDQITLSREGESLVFSNAEGDHLSVGGWLADDGLNAGLQSVEFLDGTVWNGDAIRAQLVAGTAGDDLLIGYGDGDELRKSRRWWDGGGRIQMHEQSSERRAA